MWGVPHFADYLLHCCVLCAKWAAPDSISSLQTAGNWEFGNTVVIFLPTTQQIIPIESLLFKCHQLFVLDRMYQEVINGSWRQQGLNRGQIRPLIAAVWTVLLWHASWGTYEKFCLHSGLGWDFSFFCYSFSFWAQGEGCCILLSQQNLSSSAGCTKMEAGQHCSCMKKQSSVVPWTILRTMTIPQIVGSVWIIHCLAYIHPFLPGLEESLHKIGCLQ